MDGRSRCFTWSSAASANDNVEIFRRSSVYLAEIIWSALGVDVRINCSENSDLFLGVKCYQHSLRFQRASDNNKWEEDFNARENLKEKRLWRLNVRREQSWAWDWQKSCIMKDWSMAYWGKRKISKWTKLNIYLALNNVFIMWTTFCSRAQQFLKIICLYTNTLCGFPGLSIYHKTITHHSCEFTDLEAINDYIQKVMSFYCIWFRKFTIYF